jgi:hypothetical protein
MHKPWRRESWIQTTQSELKCDAEYLSIPFKRVSLCDGDRFALLLVMKEKALTVSELMLLAGTRVALGAGIGLLISNKLNQDQRAGAGWALLGVGILSSVPILMGILTKRPIGERQLTLAA